MVTNSMEMVRCMLAVYMMDACRCDVPVFSRFLMDLCPHTQNDALHQLPLSRISFACSTVLLAEIMTSSDTVHDKYMH